MSKRQVFVLEVIDTQMDTWQGQLRWIQGRKESPFRSILELLHLIDSALGDSGHDLLPGSSGLRDT